MKNIWWLYLVPNLYLVVWLQWSSYGIVAADLSFLLISLPLGMAVLFLQPGSEKLWMKGSILQFAVNLLLTYPTMQWNPPSPHGGSWSGMMEIMGASEFVMIMSLVLLFLQIVIVYPLVLASENKKK